MEKIKGIFLQGNIEIAKELLQREDEIPDIISGFRVCCTNAYLSLLNGMADNFHLIIVTNGRSVTDIATEIIRNAKNFCKDNTVVELPPEVIYPTQGIRDFNFNIICEYRDRIKNSGICSSEITTITIKDGFAFAVDGHHRLVAANMEHKKFVPCEVVCNEYATKLDIADYYDFEDMSGITFATYPTK